MKLHDIHRAADAAGVKAAESCPSSSKEMGFAFLKFPENTPWGLWAKSRGLSIQSAKREQKMMIRRYDSNMPKKIAYTNAYAEFLKQQGIQVNVRIDRGKDEL